MKKGFGILLALMSPLMLCSVASAENIRIEGESYSKINCQTYNIVTHANLSGEKALFMSPSYKIGERYSVEYNVNVPEDGTYSLEGVIGRYDTYYTGNIHFSINGGEEFCPEHVTQADYSDWWVEQRPDYFSKYSLGTVKLKKGINNIKILIAENDVVVDVPFARTVIDYIDISPAATTFEITKVKGVTDAAELFFKGQTVKVNIDFSCKAPRKEGFSFVLENVWEEEIKSGKVVLEEGTENYVLNLGNLPVGWYRIKFTDGKFKSTLYDKYMFAVVEKVSDIAKLNDKFTIDPGLGYSGNMLVQNKLIKSLEYIGVPLVRIGTDPGYVLEDDAYWPAHFGTTTHYLEQSDIKTLNVYEHFTWMDFKDLPEDLTRAYNMNKKLATYNSGSGAEYEVWNEQDANFLNVPADTFSSYYKAAALGIFDGASDSFVGFGGLAGSREDVFGRLMLSNDIMNYSDYYNYHAHINTGNERSKVDYPSGKAFGHVLRSQAYDTEKPTWMNEGGISIPVDENGVASLDAQIAQARYYIVSNMQALAMSEDRRSWFRFGYFMEKGNTYGCHTKDINPHVVVSTISAFHNNIGKGDYKGKLINIPEGAEGHVVNNGKNDIAVVWCETADVIKLTSDKKVTVTDFVGGKTTITPVEGKVTVPISYYPVILSFENEVDVNDYMPYDYCEQKAKRPVYEENDRIIIQQIWENEELQKAKSNGYTIDWGEEQKVRIRIYNFNTTPQSGKIYIKTGSNIVSDDVLELTDNTFNFDIQPMSFKECALTVKLSDKAKVGDAGYFMIEGALSDGREISASKSRYTTSNEGRIIEEYPVYTNWNIADKWDETCVGACKADVTYSDEEKALRFDLMFSKPNWAWPRMDIENMEETKGSQGITFKIKTANKGTAHKVNIFVYYEDGTDYWLGMDGHFPVSDEWQQYVIPWKEFTLFYSALGAVDTRGFRPELISKVGFGCDSVELEQHFYLKDVGFYFSDLPADNDSMGELIMFTNIEEDAKYNQDEQICVKAKLPDIKFKELKVILNERSYTDFTVDGNEVTVNLQNLERGKYTLEICGIDEWNDANFNHVNFYVE